MYTEIKVGYLYLNFLVRNYHEVDVFFPQNQNDNDFNIIRFFCDNNNLPQYTGGILYLTSDQFGKLLGFIAEKR